MFQSLFKDISISQIFSWFPQFGDDFFFLKIFETTTEDQGYNMKEKIV